MESKVQCGHSSSFNVPLVSLTSITTFLISPLSRAEVGNKRSVGLLPKGVEKKGMRRMR